MGLLGSSAQATCATYTNECWYGRFWSRPVFGINDISAITLRASLPVALSTQEHFADPYVALTPGLRQPYAGVSPYAKLTPSLRQAYASVSPYAIITPPLRWRKPGVRAHAGVSLA